MNESRLVIFYKRDISTEVFNEFLDEAKTAHLSVGLESKEIGPTAGIDWLLPTAVIVYLAKPFVDEILKRSAEEVGDWAYPKLKSAIGTLAKKILIATRGVWKIVTVSGEKPRVGKSPFFSIVSETNERTPVKFVFDEGLSAQEYEERVDRAVKLVLGIRSTGIPDPLHGAMIDNYAGTRTIYLFYVPEKQDWQPIDVKKEIQKTRSRKRDGN
jgi:hypothetical protein